MIIDRYSQDLSTEVDEALRTTSQRSSSQGWQSIILGKFYVMPINRIVENILDLRLLLGLQMYIEPQINNIRVRYRIDGILSRKIN
jgi:type II secretory ATPase GspE/PulE/Tfp pilus assembly ATPase PilB-like protein